MKKFIRYFVIIILTSIITYGTASIYEQKYIPTEYNSLHEKYDSFISETERMECNSFTNPMICEFKIDYSDNLGSKILILVVALWLIIGLIGVPSHGIGFSEVFHLDMGVSEEKRKEIDARPMYLGIAIAIFVGTLYLIQYLNSGYVNKTFDFKKKTLYLTNSQNNDIIQSHNLSDIKNIELIKLTDTNYEHYELNIHLMDGKRIHIFSRKDDISTVLYARILADKMNKPIEKILVNL